MSRTETIILHLVITRLWKILPLEELSLIRDTINRSFSNPRFFNIDPKYGIKYSFCRRSSPGIRKPHRYRPWQLKFKI
jgi:hypothetical protein